MSVTSVSSVIVEIRAAEGGEDAKSLVDEQLRIYARRALHHGL
jgi:protein subunit release factor A